nr:DUF6124 family protein [uncultured Pseudomonas sp.]
MSVAENCESNHPHNTADHPPSIADIKATPRKICTLFSVNLEFDTETLLAYAYDSLASANVMATDLVDHLEGSSRNALLGIAQVILPHNHRPKKCPHLSKRAFFIST